MPWEWHGHPAREGVMAGRAMAKACGGRMRPRSGVARMAMPRPATSKSAARQLAKHPPLAEFS